MASSMSEADALFAQTRRALAEGRLAEAEAGLRRLLADRPHDPALAHVAAQLLKRQGRLEAARQAYENALAAMPGEAALHAEYASLLDDLGDGAASVAAYDRAIALAPSLLDARIDRAIVMGRRVDRARGLEALDIVTRTNPDSARAWRLLALLLRENEQFDEAADAIAQAAHLTPLDARVLRAQAQLAFDRGYPASRLFRAARDADPSTRELIISESAALLQEERVEDAEALLVDAVADDPAWYDALFTLAHIRWQRGDGEAFARAHSDAIAKRPDDLRLWVDLATITQRSRGERPALAVLEEARSKAGEHPVFDNVEANIRTELGDLDRARLLFAQLDRPDEPSLEIARIRFLIHDRDFGEAARRGEALIAKGLGAHAWPYVSIAWRMLGDPRWGWLEGERDLARVFDLAGLVPELPALAERLRAFHRWKIHPFQQSLRGGTQTDTVLFARAEAEITSLVRHIRAAVRDYLDGLPAPEKGHPLLDMPRGDFRFSGSWSVRLTGEGFHVNHIHSQGLISSAFYVALPDAIGTADAAHDGWLALGEPAAEFDLGLPPLREVEPRPGRLVLFPSWMWHGTRPFASGERLTVAFDVMPI